MVKLNLGKGSPDAYGVDLEGPWPWADASVDKILAERSAEYCADPVHFMNEAWRVLRFGGHIDITVPSTDARNAFMPGYKSYWNENCWAAYKVDSEHRPDGFRGAFRIQAGSTPVDPHKQIWTRAVCTKVNVDASVILVPEDPAALAGRVKSK